MDKNIVILGAGRIGRAIECLLENKDSNIELWDADETKNPGQKELSVIVPEADFIFMCMPSWVLRKALEDIKETAKSDAIVVSFQKGVEKETKKLTPEIMEDVLGKEARLAYIGGPMIAEECMNGQISAGVVATKDKSAFEEINELFQGTTLILEHSEDLRGIALVGVLKNIYAFSLGIVNGLGWGKNGKGWLVTKIIGEMEQVTKELGGDESAVFTVAGIGDLIGTGFSEDSCNFRHGTALGKGEASELKSEGFNSLPFVLEMLGQSEEYLILSALKSAFTDGEAVKEVFDKLTEND